MLSCFSSRPRTTILAVLAVCVALAVGPAIAMGQIPTAETDQDVALVVDGRVQKVYRDGDQCLVQILVRKSEMPRLSAVAGVRYPAPGELVYVHVDLQSRGIDRVVRRSGAKMLPDPNSPIRAFLTAGQNGRWEAVGRDWFEENPTNNDVAWSDRWPRDRSTPDLAGGDAASLGVETQRNGIGRGNGLKVVQVRPHSAAAKAGIEPGDILVEVDGSRLSSQQQLDEAFRASAGTLAVTVRDIRTNREVQVEVDARGGAPLAPWGTGKTLGVETEIAFYNGEPAPQSHQGRSQ